MSARVAGHRARLIADLEAHYGRLLGALMIRNYQAYAPIAEQARIREAEGTARPPMPRSEVMAWRMKVEGPAYRVAIESVEAVQTARGIEDDKTLEVFVRWKTQTNWRWSMLSEGWAFDEETVTWSHPTRGHLPS